MGIAALAVVTVVVYDQKLDAAALVGMGLIIAVWSCSDCSAKPRLSEGIHWPYDVDAAVAAKGGVEEVAVWMEDDRQRCAKVEAKTEVVPDHVPSSACVKVDADDFVAHRNDAVP